MPWPQSGLGPLLAQLDDPQVTSLLIRGRDQALVQRSGEWGSIPLHWKEDGELRGHVEDLFASRFSDLDADHPLAARQVGPFMLIGSCPPVSETYCLAIRRVVPHLEIEELALSMRTFNALRRAGIHTLSDMLARSREEFRSLRGIGDQSLAEIVATVQGLGLTLPRRGV